jgi:DNA-binding beta-propeller fold protein YncE
MRNHMKNNMKKRSLTIVVLVILAVIFAVIAVDFINNRPDRRRNNPYALDVDRYKKVDPALVSHREARNLSLGPLKASCMVLYDDMLYIAGDSTVVRVRPDGTREQSFAILPGPTCLLVDGQDMFVGYKDFVVRYDRSGNLISRWENLGENTVITNLAGKEDKVYVADAGNRRIVIFDRQGNRTGEFEGKAETEAGHGFIVPSANFDLAVNTYGELWVVNPGKHALENYTDDGRMRGFWENASMEIDGFTGCCNPARITVMEDGAFVTSEKGMVRIKIHDASGSLRSVVAGPEQFKEEGMAPDVCVDESGVVYALDFDRNTVRIFEPKDNG